MLKRQAFIFTAAVATALVAVGSAAGERISREALIEDARQLASIIEEVHPDPYVNGGGKLAFHRRLQDVLAGIPDDGMSSVEFYDLLLPFVAGIGDGHTRLDCPYSFDPMAPGGVPLYFQPIEQRLFVAAVPGEEYRDMIGAILVSVEGVPSDDLVTRLTRIEPAENIYHVLSFLVDRLWNRPHLERLIPEWTDHGEARVELRYPDGRTHEHTLPVPQAMSYPLIYNASVDALPSTERCDFVYDFVDPDGKIAHLVISDMSTYREAFEIWRSYGVDRSDNARRVYERYHASAAPDDIADVIAGLPSATEVFRSLVRDMKGAGTEALIVDLRMNGGGSSAMYDILVYFLYGRDTLASLGRSVEIRKLSTYYLDTHPGVDLEEVSEGRPFRLVPGDCTFPEDIGALRPMKPEALDEHISRMPTFAAECATGEYGGHHRPDEILVLCSTGTFSSGFTLMHYLYRLGATLVGSTSAQAGNCFGDIVPFELRHSGLAGHVSHKRFEYFPEDPEKGRALRPHYELTYEKLASYGFDLNAEMLYALEVLGATPDAEN